MFEAALGRPMVHAADEYYLLAGRGFPARAANMTGSACTRTASAWPGPSSWSSVGSWPRGSASNPGSSTGWTGRPQRGTGAPQVPRRRLWHRQRGSGCDTRSHWRSRRGAPIAVLSGTYGAQVLEPLICRAGPCRRAVVPVANELLRWQHRRDRPDGRRGRRTGAGRAAGRTSLSAARRVPVQGVVPRRNRARGSATAGGGRRHRRRDVASVLAGRRPGSPEAGRDRSGRSERGDRRTPERGQVDAAQPDRRVAAWRSSRRSRA